MSLLHVAGIDSIDLTKDDELDVMAASSPVVPTRTSQLAAEGRALRPRQSAGYTITIPSPLKRSRRMSDSTNENHQEKAAAKKLKLEDKKAVCVPDRLWHLSL